MSSRKIQVGRGAQSSGTQSVRSVRAPQRMSAGRRMTLAARRRRAHMFVSGLSVIALVTFIWLVSWTSYRPVLSVHGVEVSGTRELSPRLLEAFAHTIIYDGYAHMFSRQNMLLYPRGDIEELLKDNFPRIRYVSAAIVSISSGVVGVSVEEREPYALWCRSTHDCFYIDSEGVIFEQAGAIVAEGAYIFTGGVARERPIGTQLLPNNFNRVNMLMDGVHKLGVDAKELAILNDKDFTIKDTSGLEIRVSFSQNNEEILSNVKVVLESDVLRDKRENLEYIDLRFGNRVYYKMKDE